MTSYTPNYWALKFMRTSAGLTTGEVGALLGVAHTQVWRWERPDTGGSPDPAAWKQKAEPHLALGQPPIGEGLLYMLGVKDDDGVEWVNDQEGRVLLFLDGDLAHFTANAFAAMGHEAAAFPASSDYINTILDGRSIVQADTSPMESVTDPLAVRALIFEHLASVERGLILRLQRQAAAEARS